MKNERMKNIVFLCSGGGGNLKFLHHCKERGFLPDYQISAVISDRDCGALYFADQVGLPAHKVAYSRQSGEDLLRVLKNYNPDVIITSFHKILDEKLVDRFRGRLINLHYSLLPAFKGTIGEKPVRDALASGCKFVGTTTHFVDEQVDAGEIICQSVVPIVAGRTFELTMNSLFRAGCFTLLNTLFVIASLSEDGGEEGAEVGGVCAYFSPPLRFNSKQFDRWFWSEIR